MDPQEAPLEIISGDALNALERGQIDMQIATAKKYPRSIKQFMDEAKSMIAINQETAESCNYRLKRKEKDGSVKYIEGPSIRLLEIAATAYTNLRYGSRIIALDKEFVTAQGVAFDLQKNVAVTVETKRSIVSRDGRRYSVDMIMVTSNAAGSIARRNALNGCVPRAYINELAAHAKQIAVGDIKTLKERLQRAFDYFTKTLGVDQAKVLAYLEKPSISDCTLDDLEELQGLRTMLKENEISLDTAFPDAASAKGDTPDLAGTPPAPKPELEDKPKAAPAPAAAAPVPAPTPAVPAKEKPAAPSAPASRKRVAKPAPEPEPEPEPAAEPEPAESGAPVLTFVERANALDMKLEQEGVEVGEFFDWCKSSGRDRKYKFDPDKCESIGDVPEKLVDDLSADNFAGLVPCIRVFGKAAKAKG